jgi:mannitol/fructose-specific phosphotransferase system IIA component (Ntr-type)
VVQDLLDVLQPEDIYLGVPASDKDSLLEWIAGKVSERNVHIPSSRILEKLRDREKVMSTGIGNRVAVPHVSLDGFREPRILLFLLEEDIDFQAIDGQPVRVVFLLLVRPDDIAFHLQGLSTLARLARNPALADVLGAASRPEDVLSRLRDDQESLG